MHSLTRILAMALLLGGWPAFSGEGPNTYPIVLVGGLGVWGRDELLGIKYWGGLVDLESELNKAGYRTVTSAVGPVSSYWDRACELYAQIKGTVVDYGADHAARHGHLRFGRNHRGKPLVGGWGREVPKVHLMGHSMGGPTGRAMATLLAFGSPQDVARAKQDPQPDPNAGEPSLFDGGKDWVSGIMTIASPHDGTTLPYLSRGQMDVHWVQNAVTSWVSLWEGGNGFYDFKLDQWGLTRGGRTSEDYTRMVAQSGLWSATKDLSSWDGTLEGAQEFNTWAVDVPAVYYFSWATKASRKARYQPVQLPLLTMNPIWMGFSKHLGSYARSGPIPVDASWWDNDGVVNTCSMAGPRLTRGAPSVILSFDGSPHPGVWNHLGVMEGWDHSDIIGFTLVSVKEWYIEQARLLAGLPR